MSRLYYIPPNGNPSYYNNNPQTAPQQEFQTQPTPAQQQPQQSPAQSQLYGGQMQPYQQHQDSLQPPQSVVQIPAPPMQSHEQPQFGLQPTQPVPQIPSFPMQSYQQPQFGLQPIEPVPPQINAAQPQQYMAYLPQTMQRTQLHNPAPTPRVGIPSPQDLVASYQTGQAYAPTQTPVHTPTSESVSSRTEEEVHQIVNAMTWKIRHTLEDATTPIPAVPAPLEADFNLYPATRQRWTELQPWHQKAFEAHQSYIHPELRPQRLAQQPRQPHRSLQQHAPRQTEQISSEQPESPFAAHSVGNAATHPVDHRSSRISLTSPRRGGAVPSPVSHVQNHNTQAAEPRTSTQQPERPTTASRIDLDDNAPQTHPLGAQRGYRPPKNPNKWDVPHNQRPGGHLFPAVPRKPGTSYSEGYPRRFDTGQVNDLLTRPGLLGMAHDECQKVCFGVYMVTKKNVRTTICPNIKTPERCPNSHKLTQKIVDALVTKRGVSHNTIRVMITSIRLAEATEFVPHIQVPRAPSSMAPTPAMLARTQDNSSVLSTRAPAQNIQKQSNQPPRRQIDNAPTARTRQASHDQDAWVDSEPVVNDKNARFQQLDVSGYHTAAKRSRQAFQSETADYDTLEQQIAKRRQRSIRFAQGQADALAHPSSNTHYESRRTAADADNMGAGGPSRTPGGGSVGGGFRARQH